MTEYETTVICPDTDVGHQALQERIAEGWEFFCSWTEHRYRGGVKLGETNHIALRFKITFGQIDD